MIPKEHIFQGKGKKLQIIFICLIFAIIFLVLSEYSTNTGSKTDDRFDESGYTAALETKLKNIIEQMEGVSQVNIMITLEGSEEYHFVSSNTSYDSSFLFSSADSAKDPMISAIGTPPIKGVSVVCKGAEDSALRLKITKLIASTLNLTENQIYVTQ